MNCAEYHKENEFKTLSYRQTVQIHPSSVLFSSKPAFLLYNELVQTNKTYMRYDSRCLTAEMIVQSLFSIFEILKGCERYKF